MKSSMAGRGSLVCGRLSALGAVVALLLSSSATWADGGAALAARPNVVVMLWDDLGYGDLGCYGGQPTPAIDRLAGQGVRCSDFYAAQPVCSASRAALLTGCYPNRIGIAGALGPGSAVGIGSQERTLAELCASVGYRTAMVGKWHLGDAPQFLPTRHGFDEYFGIPYSNDMWPLHPETPKAYPNLPLLASDARGDRVVDPELTPQSQSTLTARFTSQAVAFIESSAQAEAPFFLYLAHPMPHVPLAPGADFAGSTGRGTHADVLAELDWSAGQVFAALERAGVADDTLVIVLSDNGPWLSYGDHAGSAGNLREGKGTTWEGGVRVPCILRWPGRLPAGEVFHRPAMAIDILPTVARAIGAALPDHSIDGRDLLPWLNDPKGGPEADPHDALAFYYESGSLQAVRSGRWKLHLPHSYRTLADAAPGRGGRPATYRQASTGLALYDLVADPGESVECSSQHPDEVARLSSLAEEFRQELGDRSAARPGTGLRPAGLRKAASRHPGQPNIVLCLVDDLGWQDTSVPVTPEPTPLNRRWRTPNLSQLAQRGMRFTNAFASAPVCTPTRTAIMTGQSPARSHITYWILESGKDTSSRHPRLAPPAWRTDGLGPADITLPGLLAEAGYRTIHVGKAHWGAAGSPGAVPTALGFQVTVAGHAAGAPGSYLGSERFEEARRKGTPEQGPSIWDVPGLEAYHDQDIFLEEALAAEASKAVRAAAADGKPFFLSFCPYAVHAPITANRRHLRQGGGLDEIESAYASMIETVDAALGTVLAAIEAAGELDDTVVIVTSDNGGLSAHARGEAPDGSKAHHHNEPARSGKGSAYDGGLRVPLIVAWPGRVAANSSNASLVVSHDLFPTVLRMAGVAVPRELVGLVDGVDLTPALEAGFQQLASERAILWHQPHDWGARGPGIEPFSALRAGDWKLIAFHDGPRFELYDVAHDVGETRDRAADEPARVADLSLRLVEALESSGAQMSILRASGRPVSLERAKIVP